jgi:8-oxo-(d)GTP phosphatase
MAIDPEAAEVKASGGVVLRRAGGRLEVAVVHRPKYDDWSFPKGKLFDGESHVDAALREVSEETGLSCRLGPELPSSSYDVDGHPKVVRYWWMAPDDGTALSPTDEIDEARWVPLEAAARRLTHGPDRELLAAVAGRSGSAYLIRHAKAGSRSQWTDADELRPLSTSGRRQAKAIVHAFDGIPVSRVLSSPAVRCVQTVQPLAAARSRSVEERDELAEGRSLRGALKLLEEVEDGAVVFSGHGDLIPAIVEHAEAHGAIVGSERGWKKASTWVLEREAGAVVRMRYLPPPEVAGPSKARSTRRTGTGGRGR